MTNTIITENNFNGNWRFIPSNNGNQSQLILSKGLLTKNNEYENVSYNFNYDDKYRVIGKPTSLMNELLGLNKNLFYKCNIDDNCITFIVMIQSEINEYNQRSGKNQNT